MPPALGRRGEGWVVLQVLVIVLIAVAGRLGGAWPSGSVDVTRIVGYVLLALGLGLSVTGMRHLGPALTPYPKPGEDAELREHGSYRLVRHPIYGGLLVAAVGWSFVTSPLALVAVALLALVFWGKSIREETWLDERYLGYGAYRERVRHRFVPYVW